MRFFFTKLFILSLISLSLMTCSRSQDDKFELYRFIDRLEKKHVVNSPYLGLEKRLRKIKQKWTGKDLLPLAFKGKKVHAISSKSPILAWDTESPSGILSFTSGGTDVPAADLAGPDVLSWSVQKGEHESDSFSKEKRRYDLYPLTEEDGLEQHILLPDGAFLIQVWAESKDPQAQNPRMRIDLNGESIGTILIGPYQCYTITGQTDMGWQTISFHIECQNNSTRHEKTEILVDKIFVKSTKDLILVSAPDGGSLPRSTDFEVKYFAEPEESIYKVRKDLKDSQSCILNIQIDSKKEYTVEIFGQSSATNAAVEVQLDGQNVFTGKVTSHCQNTSSFDIANKRGKHELQVTFRSPQFPEKSFYLSDVIVKESTKEAILLLSKMKQEALIYDLPITIDPLHTKKKIVIQGYSKNLSRRVLDDTVNVLMAPPSSMYSFELRVPPSSMLEFGVGIHNPYGKNPAEEVAFQVVIEDKGKEDTLFLKNVLPYGRRFYGDSVKERIDLSSYADKKVRVKFITTFAPSTQEQNLAQEDIPRAIAFAYWENPVIYRALNSPSQSDNPPNIIMISLDTLRADHLKCYGYHRETSTNMDNLAAEGVLFEKAFSSTSWTLPAHMSLLTSLDNRNHGVRKATPFLDTSIVTLADILRKNDYFTHAITGGALVSQRYGFSKGFDSYREFKRSRRFSNMAKTQYSHVQRWMEWNKDKKFFLFLHTYQPHAPYTCPPPYNTAFLSENMPWEEGDMETILFGEKKTEKAPFNKLSPLEQDNIVALYDGEIKYTDEVLIKPLIKKLKDLSLYQNTMIILTSDHGEEFFDHNAWLHGHTLYNELIHIPLIIKFPHSKLVNLCVEDDVRIIDIMPTILDELGIDHAAYGLDGRSLIPRLHGLGPEEQTFIADLEELKNTNRLPTRIAFTWEGYKLILNNDYGNPPEHYLPPPPPIALVELYDRTNDPSENFNIAEQNEAIVKEIIDKIYTIYESSANARGKKRKGMDKELEETMRALGYIR